MEKVIAIHLDIPLLVVGARIVGHKVLQILAYLGQLPALPQGHFLNKR